MPRPRRIVATLRARGVNVLGPGFGDQACGDVGAGRLLEADADRGANWCVCTDPSCSRDVRVVVSAGPTCEDIDPVRFIGNRSSGRMGFAIAQAAAEQGASVHLVAGPVCLHTPAGVVRDGCAQCCCKCARRFMQQIAKMRTSSSRRRRWPTIGRAQVAAAQDQENRRHAEPATGARIPDILAEWRRSKKQPFVVGFAAETEDLESHARAKLDRKSLT